MATNEADATTIFRVPSADETVPDINAAQGHSCPTLSTGFSMSNTMLSPTGTMVMLSCADAKPAVSSMAIPSKNFFMIISVFVILLNLLIV